MLFLQKHVTAGRNPPGVRDLRPCSSSFRPVSLRPVRPRDACSSGAEAELKRMNGPPNTQGQYIHGAPDTSGGNQTGTKAACPSCRGTGFKPCGQCEGTGKNLEDKFGGRVVRGAVCWLCEGAAKTMCGECVDLTDVF